MITLNSAYFIPNTIKFSEGKIFDKIKTGLQNKAIFQYLTLRPSFEAVPELHELGLDHGRGLVVVRVSGPEEGVDLVDEDDARSDLRRQGKHGAGKFL